MAHENMSTSNEFDSQTHIVTRVLNLLTPHQSPFPLLRLGGEKDGAYLVPNQLDGVTACYSPGVDNSKSFEDDLCLQYRIKCHLLDKSSDPELFKTPLIHSLQTFDKLYLGGDDTLEQISLDTFVRKYSPDNHDQLMLQMDIEGAEYEVLNTVSSATLSRFRIIIIEFHSLEQLLTDSGDSDLIEKALLRLAMHHNCVHIHFNNNSEEYIDKDSNRNFSSLCEATFLHKSFFQLDLPTLPIHLPHPDDLALNVAERPPLNPNRAWLNGNRSTLSEIKVLYDSAVFLQHRIRKEKLNGHLSKANATKSIAARISCIAKSYLSIYLLNAIKIILRVNSYLLG